MADAASDTDALNRQTADGRYYSNTTALNNITMAAGDVTLNSNKITNLGAPVNSNDAVNLGYVTNNYYANTTRLD